jgi:hypothetical protein
MACRPTAFVMCDQPHECQKCGKVTLCQTYRWACPWLNGDLDQVCFECWDGLTVEEKAEMMKDQDGMES